ncbi:MAG: adenylate kinase [Nanoarchaeota archaeon]
MKLIIIGPQGSGKGTQAKLLSEKLNVLHISTGDIFRDNIKKETELGKKAQEYINFGKLVPDELTVKLVESKIKEDICKNGFILDGFPRNLIQAKSLDGFTDIDCVIVIDISDKEAIKRISGRRTCEECGKIFNVNTDNINNKCKFCDGNLIQRDDDVEETVKERLKTYHEITKPVINYYKEQNKTIVVDGERAIEIIFDEIIKKIKK